MVWESMSRTVEVLPNLEALIARALEITLTKLQSAIAERDQATIALAGGSTPKPLYQALAAQALPWDKIHVFWGDERYVPPTHPDSNQGMARQAWLDQVSFPPENIHPIPTAAADPQVAAAQHEQELMDFFQTGPGEFPTFDLILLGIGDDAHTASLFPYTTALQVSDRLVTVGNKDDQPRITFTVPLINQAYCVLFMAAGANKQSALAQIFAPDANPMMYPARLIAPQGELIWLLDRAAGGYLS